MDKNYLVTKSNYFIMNSSYDLSLEEQKIILTLASMVQPEDEDFKPYKFRISDFMELLGVEDKSKYTQIPKLTKELMKKVFEIHEGNKLIQTAWLSGAVYEKGSGEVELTFSSYLKPYMLQLRSMFTQYKLANILSMKSKYSPRIYEILKCNEFKKQGFIEIEIEDLRKLIKAYDVYPKYNDFKRHVIERSKKELNKISDICFEFEEIKTGRKVTSLKFHIKSNKSNVIENKKEIKNIKAKAIEEVSVTESEENKMYYEIINKIKVICGEKISLKNAKEFYELASNHELGKNYPLGFIEEVAKYSKTQDVRGFIGWFKRMLKKYERPIKSNKQLTFDNFEGRGPEYYGDSSLEKKLLGWDED